MRPDYALTLMTELFWTGLLICLPVLCLTMLVGLLVSIFQVVTQIQEMSLTFVPKLLSAMAVLVFAGPWMLRTLTQFAIKLWTNIPQMM
jgi:flagellar biosynthetic protein FliQ